MVYLDLFLSFVMVGFTSFGGLSMVPLINSEMLSHGWMTAREVSDIVAIAEMTPGPLGLNCATFAGMRVAGVLGALSASLGVLVPSLTLCMIAAACLNRFKESRLLGEMMYGIRPVCIGMIAAVILDLAGTNYAGALFGLSPSLVLIGVAAFLAMYFAKWSVPKAILLSAALGLLTGLWEG